MIEGNFSAKNPDKIQMEMRITMPMGDWKRLRDQLRSSERSTEYPSWQLRTDIDCMVQKAEKEFYPDPQAEDDDG